jgi:hypothetical protein
MKTLVEIQEAVRYLTHAEQDHLLEFLENVIEDRLELTNEFKAEVEQGKTELAAGLGRVVKP